MTERHWVFLSGSIAGTIAVTLGLAIATSPSDADTVATVFPPWWTPATIMEAGTTAGAVIDVGRFASVLIVHSDSPGLAARLHAAGALIVLNVKEAGGCRTRRTDLKI